MAFDIPFKECPEDEAETTESEGIEMDGAPVVVVVPELDDGTAVVAVEGTELILIAAPAAILIGLAVVDTVDDPEPRVLTPTDDPAAETTEEEEAILGPVEERVEDTDEECPKGRLLI